MGVDQNSVPRRQYRMSQRLEGIEETRRRITAAAFELHASIGPSQTSVKAIAERAGVQRHTVYAHFPDLDRLYVACTEHGMQAMAMPHATPWLAIPEPMARMRHGCGLVYGWYRANAAALETLLRDADPSGAPDAIGTAAATDPYAVRMAEMASALLEPWNVTAADRRLLAAVLGHALAFETWRSLAGAGLEDADVVALMVSLAETAASGAIRPDAGAISVQPVRRDATDPILGDSPDRVR